MPDGATADVLARLVSNLESVFRERLEAVVLYGAAAHLPGSRAGGPRDVAYTLAVVGSLSVTDLRACAALAPSWRAKRVATPLMLTPGNLRRSLDVFPLEFAEILAEHRVLHGKNPFAGLSVSRDDLRRACEVHARGHALHLREGYVESGADPRQLAQVIVHSAVPLASLLAGFSRARGNAGRCAGLPRPHRVTRRVRCEGLPRGRRSGPGRLDAGGRRGVLLPQLHRGG